MTPETTEGRGSRVTGRGYQQLRAWQSAHALALRSFRACESLRPGHRWLANQFARSAVSVAANIAEGYNRGSLREYLQFLRIARGSLAEAEYYVIFTDDAGLLPAAEVAELMQLVEEAGSLLFGLVRSLEAKDGGRESRMIREESEVYVAVEDNAPPTPDPRPMDPRPATRDPYVRR